MPHQSRSATPPSTAKASRDVSPPATGVPVPGAKAGSRQNCPSVEGAGGSIAAFPPPHNFFWARETEFNLGYNWYRKDSDTSFAFGVRQAEGEEDPSWQGHGPEDRRQNYALYSARPGTW